MRHHGDIVFGLLAVSGGLIICSLALSTAGVSTAAIWFSGLGILFVLAGFFFAYRYHQSQNAIWRKKMLVSKKSSFLLSQAIESFDAWQESADNFNDPELTRQARAIAAEKAQQAVFALQNIQVTKKTLALASLEQAIQAQKELMRLQENDALEEASQKALEQAEEKALEAIRQIKKLNYSIVVREARK